MPLLRKLAIAREDFSLEKFKLLLGRRLQMPQLRSKSSRNLKRAIALASLPRQSRVYLISELVSSSKLAAAAREVSVSELAELCVARWTML